MNKETLSIILLPPITRKEKEIKERIEGGPTPVVVMQVVDAWNEHEYIRFGALHERRNNPIEMDDVDEQRARILYAVNVVGRDELLDQMAAYLTACSEGLHIRDRKNFGFKNLTGFINKMIHWQKDKKKTPLWWSRGSVEKVEDNHPKLTLHIADQYAKIFLGRKKYGVKNPSIAYRHFKLAGDRIIKYYDSVDLWEINEIVHMLLKCIKSHCNKTNGTPSAARLCSDHTWAEIFPRYIKRILDK